MSYIYPGDDTYISRYATGHIVSSILQGEIGYRVLCGKKFDYDNPDWTHRKEAAPGTSLCSKCKQIRQDQKRKRPTPKVVTEADLRRWNEMLK